MPLVCRWSESLMVPERLVANCEVAMVWLEQLPTAVRELERLWPLTLSTAAVPM